MSEYIEKKRCCTGCDAKQLCHICRSITQYACSDCAIDFGVTIHVCNSRACREAHETKCSARLGEQLVVLRAEVAEWERRENGWSMGKSKALRGQIADLRAQLTEVKAELKQWQDHDFCCDCNGG